LNNDLFQQNTIEESKSRRLFNITSLNLSWCRGLTDLSFEYICKNCPNLQEYGLCERFENKRNRNAVIFFMKLFI
jgi:hypothetical protein